MFENNLRPACRQSLFKGLKLSNQGNSCVLDSCKRWFGMAVGSSSLSNDTSRNFLTCNRESKSGRVLNKPGMCSAENNLLYFISVNTNILIKIMIFESFDVCAFTVLTTAALSV